MAENLNTVNDDTYNRLYAAWIKTHSIRASAMEAGCSPATAAKYINTQTMSDGRPGIRERIRQNYEGELASLDAELRKVTEGAKSVLNAKFGELLLKLQKIELVVKGETLPSGKIGVTEHTFRRLVGIAQTLSELTRTLTVEQRRLISADKRMPDVDEPDGTTSGNQGTTNVVTEVRSDAFDIIRQFEMRALGGCNDSEQRTATERSLIETCTKATLRGGGGKVIEPAYRRTAGNDSEEEELPASNN